MPSANTEERFFFKEFAIAQDRCTMKVGTDGVLLGAWADVKGAARILDIGTGTGVIAIMLGQRTKDQQSTIHAIEIDADSARQAKENAESAPWSERIKIIHGSIQQYVSTPEPYDLIVSNPPFFSGGTFSRDQDRTNVRHTVKLAHGDLLAAVRNLLSPEGRFCVVLPWIEGLRFQELAAEYHLHCTRETRVKPKKEKPVSRLLLQFEREEKAKQVSELVIQKEGRNEWTDDYRALTAMFYLKM